MPVTIRRTMNLIPAGDSLETRRVLSGNSLSHAFDRFAHNIDHLGQQISHLGQHHSTDHAAVNGAMNAATNMKVHYHHIVK